MTRSTQSSAKIARGGKARRESDIGRTVTCPCGFEYVIGTPEEKDHFVRGGGTADGGGNWVGECPMLYGLEGAGYIIYARGWRYAYLPGETEGVRSNLFKQRPVGLPDL